MHEPSGQVLNEDAPWNSFDPRTYVETNYRCLTGEDARILEIVRDHFVGHFEHAGDDRSSLRGIDVGTGGNLYPALSLLPWCHEITLCDRAAPNVEWLKRQEWDALSEGGAWLWNQFWEILALRPPYRSIPQPRSRLGTAVRVEQGNLFDLPSGAWGIGTMFFVAESMSTSHEEFARAVRSFLHSLEPGAPFAAAFVEGSAGYHVGPETYPACRVSDTHVRACLRPYADSFEITLVDPSDPPFRDGYTGMIVACGRRNSRPAGPEDL
ncbi:SCO2525 family SAM-dependent methyltransferase [Streptomyces sp. NPDC047072]|uniref:SCO2525 family SAM-dependent methyltransferase n=1 Tax=Streptomyces sp. NPDC047072 TaxID=3154809 RepID=UPI0033DD9A74